jgi:hypothetical protein
VSITSLLVTVQLHVHRRRCASLRSAELMLGCGARRGTGVLGAGLAVLALVATGSAASASAPSHWLAYFPSHVGRTCVEGLTLHSGGETIVSTGTQRLASITRSGAVTTIVEKVVTVVKETPPPSTPLEPMYQTLRYTFPADGSIATAPGAYSNSLWHYTYSGAEVFPPVAALRAGQSRPASLSLTMTGATSSTAATIAPYLLPGYKGLDITLRYEVGPAPAKSQITTPAGTFRHLLGVEFHITAVSVTDATKKGAAELRPLLSALGEEISATTYFAPGAGAVATTTLGHTVLLDRCSG